MNTLFFRDRKNVDNPRNETSPRRWIKRLATGASITIVLLCIGWMVLIYIAAIENAAGEDFPSYMHYRIFDSLRMKDTLEERADGRTSLLSAFYDYDGAPEDGKIVEAPFVDYSSKWASGGFLSTAEDLVRFGSAHLEEGFLKRETLNRMFTVERRQAPIVGYGLGWMIARDLHFRRAYFHFGATFGGTSLLVIYPDKKVCIALLANLGHAKFPFARLMGVINPFLAAAR